VNDIALAESAFGEDAVTKSAGTTQIVENEAAFVEPTFHELTAIERSAAKLAILEMSPRDNRGVEVRPIETHVDESATDEGLVRSVVDLFDVVKGAIEKSSIVPSCRPCAGELLVLDQSDRHVVSKTLV
jgi:hypothetical protein